MLSPPAKGQQIAEVAVRGGGAAGVTPPQMQVQHHFGLRPLIARQPLPDHRHMLLIKFDELLGALLAIEHFAQQPHARHGVVQQIDAQIDVDHRHAGLVQRGNQQIVVAVFTRVARQDHQIRLQLQQAFNIDLAEIIAADNGDRGDLRELLRIELPALRIEPRQIRRPADDALRRVARLQQRQRIQHAAFPTTMRCGLSGTTTWRPVISVTVFA